MEKQKQMQQKQKKNQQQKKEKQNTEETEEEPAAEEREAEHRRNRSRTSNRRVLLRNTKRRVSPISTVFIAESFTATHPKKLRCKYWCHERCTHIEPGDKQFKCDNCH